MALKTVCIVQARTGSSRLPRKVLAPIAGRPLIYHVLDRAAAVRGVDELVVTIPHGDVELNDALQDYGVAVLRGPEHDVLRRYALAAEAFEADIVVRITGDCPLLAPDVAAAVLCPVKASATGAPCDYSWNDTARSGYPDGLDVEAFTARALFDADRELPRTSVEGDTDREHVTPAIRRTADRVSWLMNDNPLRSPVKLSVDTAADLALVRRLIARLKPGHYNWVATRAALQEVLPDA